MAKVERKVIPPKEKIEFESGKINLMPVKFEYFDDMTRNPLNRERTQL